MLSKISQTETNTVQYVDSKKYNKLVNITKLEDTDIGNKPAVTSGGWQYEGGEVEAQLPSVR